MVPLLNDQQYPHLHVQEPATTLMTTTMMTMTGAMMAMAMLLLPLLLLLLLLLPVPVPVVAASLSLPQPCRCQHRDVQAQQACRLRAANRCRALRRRLSRHQGE